MIKRDYVSFPAFFIMWAEYMKWDVPDFHLLVCRYLEHRGRSAVLRIFRGAAKSTIVALYQAWQLRADPTTRFLDRAADDSLAKKLSADTKNVLLKHPLCIGMTRGKLGVEKFNVKGNPDARNASVTACGILSNPTGSRADQVCNDDTEVSKNIQTPEARETLRQKLAEETHILVPGGSILYIGTPHTHDSLYDQRIKDGYEHLTIPLFAHNVRHKGNNKRTEFSFNFEVISPDDFYVMVGREVLDPQDYVLRDDKIILPEPPIHDAIVDLYGGNVWPERFDRVEIEFKRQKCETQNEWDSQYLLQAKPIHDIRLDPDHLVPYDAMPAVREANGEVIMTIGGIRMVNSRACWDCSLGKKDSDESVFSIMFTDDKGHLYWQVLDVLKGEVFDQCEQILKRVVQYQIPGVTIKTAGIGGFLPAVLRKEFGKNRIRCGINEEKEVKQKVNRILSAFEAPLSGRFLHAHKDVLASGLPEQMQDWQPIMSNQPDDKLDAGSGCILNLPVRIGKIVCREESVVFHDWRKGQGSYEVRTD